MIWCRRSPHWTPGGFCWAAERWCLCLFSEQGAICPLQLVLVRWLWWFMLLPVILLMYFSSHSFACLIELTCAIPPLKLFFLLAVCTRQTFVECFVFLAVRVSVQPNAHLRSSVLNVCQAVFVVSGGEKWNLVNKMLMYWYGVLFSTLNWKTGLQIACYILPLLGNLVEKKDPCLLCIPSGLFLSEKANSIFQMWILQEIVQSCSFFSVYSVLQMWFLQFSWGSDCLTNLTGNLSIQEQSPHCLRIEREKSY